MSVQEQSLCHTHSREESLGVEVDDIRKGERLTGFEKEGLVGVARARTLAGSLTLRY